MASVQTLAECIRVYDDALSAQFCSGLIAGFEENADLLGANGRGVREGLDDSAWTELDVGKLADPAFLGFFLKQIETYLRAYNEDLGLTIPIPATIKTDHLVMKRYRAANADRFQPHFDAIGPVSSRYLVFLWYLNDVAEGGETLFCDLDVKVAPRAGRLLMFPPYWMFQHAGLPPIGGDKYILSTYLLF
jgi:2-oxoglutarate-Fe(II)-dependent oxygenase superfamily protein